MTTTTTPSIRTIAFESLLAEVSVRLADALRSENTNRAFAELGSSRALACFIPREYGGRAEEQREILSLLEAVSYHSLSLGLTIGINGALFLQPLAKYGREGIKNEAFKRFIEEGALGGLMLTEPDYGTDVLSMRSSFEPREGGYSIRGAKHWAGLTGLADYWLVTARERREGEALKRDIDFFVCDSRAEGQSIEVEEYYPSLGLHPIPYGRNRVDVLVPIGHRLERPGSGLRLLMDLLHRSRMSFGGMAVGFLRRLLEEGLDHCKERRVGGKRLIAYDQVLARLAELQAAHTVSAAFCKHAAANSGLGRDLSGEGLAANIHKSVLTDLMQESAQSLLQLSGAQGYRADRMAGRSVVDSRPFQIFEGSNDVLYDQIAAAFLKSMADLKESRLPKFLKLHALTSRAAGYFERILDFELAAGMAQRKMVTLGRILSRVVSVAFLVDLGAAGFAPGLIDNAIELMRSKIESLAAGFAESLTLRLVPDSWAGPGWQACSLGTAKTIQ
jgi:alkylation response protein AidB-like acyl-CoA dehydrogenase